MINSPKINSLSTFLKQQQKTVPRCGAGMLTGKPRPCSLRVECPLAGCICKAFAACFPRLTPCGMPALFQLSAAQHAHTNNQKPTPDLRCSSEGERGESPGSPWGDPPSSQAGCQASDSCQRMLLWHSLLRHPDTPHSTKASSMQSPHYWQVLVNFFRGQALAHTQLQRTVLA